MLVLGRNLNETLVIDGKIFIKIVRGRQGNNLKVAIEAPREVSVVRGELFPGIEKMEAKWAKVLGPETAEQRG
ncbi:MAG: carbon storage regulator [Provencibacterium sp.]|jgi:carbon storage regulator CsrA|nr:carbon storage regulator [Provencibacterium sp.]